MFSHPKILLLVSLLFVALLNSIPTYLFEFLIFLIILVCLLFIHAKHHNNLSAGAQNVTSAYLINYACLQALVNNALTWQSSCVIANNT